MDREQQHLVLAERHIAEARRRIADQENLIAQLADGGHATAVAEQLLATMEETLDHMEAHRRILLAELALRARLLEEESSLETGESFAPASKEAEPAGRPHFERG